MSGPDDPGDDAAPAGGRPVADLDNVTPLRPAAAPGNARPAPDRKAPSAPEGGGPSDPGAEADPVLPVAAQEPANDTGNGARFALHFGADVLHVPRVGWHCWDGRCWRRDEDLLQVRGMAQRLGPLIAQELPHLPLSKSEVAAVSSAPEVAARIADLETIAAAELTEAQKSELRREKARLDKIEGTLKRLSGRRARLLSFAQSSGNSTRVSNALLEATTRLSRPHDALDGDPLKVNTLSGTLVFRVVEGDGMSPVADVVLRAHDRGDLLTKITGAGYDPAAECPTFDAFLARILPDPAMRAFMLRWLGLSMTGLKEQKLVFLYGSGANGKSVLVDVVAQVLGSYAATARIESLTGTNRRGGGDATPDLMPLIGARMVRTSEPDEGQRMQEGLIKELTGGEPIMVRALHADFVEVRPIFKLTISGNHKPEIRGGDDGIWRRVLLVPFEEQIPLAEQDRRLAEKIIAAEAPGVLRRLVDGLLDYLESGLNPPARVTEATEEYRQESDPVAAFLVDACVVTGQDADEIASRDLGDAFNFYLAERGMGMWKPTTVAKQLKAKTEGWRSPATGQGFTAHKASTMRYLGVRMQDAFRRRYNEAPIDGLGRRVPKSAAPHPD